MENYLILHIDEEFIVGAIGADYGTPQYILLDDNSPLLWLYFYNDPNQHKVSFGKGYKKPFMDRKPNYIGRFLQSIESTTNTFSLRYIPYPLIELLDKSGMMTLWKERYYSYTCSHPNSLPTLLSFSASISDLSKQTFVEYLSHHGFDIFSYTIPLAELALMRLLRQNSIHLSVGSTALFLEATNATLHLTKLTYSDGYFLKDGCTKSIVGMGIDPRKRALCCFLVNQLNSETGLLSSNDEKEQEINRFELDSAEWLRSLSMKPKGRPLYIPVSFSRAQGVVKDIRVEKKDLEADTGQYIHFLVNEYKAFLQENAITSVDFCCFVGNCFLSERIKGTFEDLLGKENAMFFSTNDLPEIITEYTRIDLKRYSEEENRIRERARADELKQQQQREAELAKKAEEEAKRKAEKEQEELLRKQREAEVAFNQANEFDNQGRLQEAKLAIEEAVKLAPANIDYKKVKDYIDDKLTKRKEKIQLYMKYLDCGDSFFTNGEYEKAKVEYEKAQEVDETTAISAKIIECESCIKAKEEKEIEVRKLLKEINSHIVKNHFDEAETIIDKILIIDKNNKEALVAKLRIGKGRAILLFNEAEELFSKGKYNNAIPLYDKAYKYDSSLKVCKVQAKRCKEIIKRLAVQQEQERSEYLNNKDRKIRELKAKCNAKLRKNEIEECATIISDFIQHMHTLGIDIFDEECTKMMSDYTIVEKPQHTSNTSVKKRETNGTIKNNNNPTTTTRTDTYSHKIESIKASKLSQPKKGSDTESKTTGVPKKNIEKKGNAKAKTVSLLRNSPKETTADELFMSLKFKDAVEEYKKEGNARMVEICGKLNRIQKRVQIRTKELEKTTAENVKPKVEELTGYLQLFKEYNLNSKEIEMLIEKYKSIK